MSKIKNSGLDHYGTELFEEQQFGTSGFEGVNGSFSEMFKIAAAGVRQGGVLSPRFRSLYTCTSI